MWHKIVLLGFFVISKICIVFLISHCKALKGFKCNELQLGAAFEILLSVIIRYFRTPSNVEIIRNLKHYVDHSQISYSM